MNYDPVKVIELVHRIDKARALLLDCANMKQGALASPMRDVVHDLRSIATELDCLRPVNEVYYLDEEASRRIFNEKVPADPIPAAPGPDYATRKELDALRASVNGADWVTQDRVIALEDKVNELHKKTITMSEHYSSRIDVLEHDQVRVLVERIENIIEPLSVNCTHLYLDRVEEAVGDCCKSGMHIAATVEQAARGRRIELYNQAYLAALPAVIAIRGRGDDSVAITAGIATQSMEYLK